jgi:amidohydrolase
MHGMTEFRAEAEALRAVMVARRRDLHQHPELAFHEVRTAQIVAAALRDLGLEVRSEVGQTGVVGLLEGDADGPTVMVRCDMDALPIQEANERDYASQTPGTMHACGHDGHTTIGLAVAELLARRQSELHGRVKFAFQPAEEIGKGALAMIADGVLADPVPDVLLGLHLWNELPVGEVGVPATVCMAGADSLHARIRGRGGHGALPQAAVDPVLTLVKCVEALQSIVSRNIHPLDTAVVSVTQIEAGSAVNVIPDEASFHGTIRTLSPEVRTHVLDRARALIDGVCAAMGASAEVWFEQMSLPVTNDPGAIARAAAAFKRAAPDLVYRENFRTMAAEDVAFFLERVPGVFFFVGAANAARGLDYPHHHPRFDIDEDALVNGAALLAAAVADYVLPGQ